MDKTPEEEYATLINAYWVILGKLEECILENYEKKTMTVKAMAKELQVSPQALSQRIKVLLRERKAAMVRLWQ